MSWYVYIALARTGNYYVGITTDAERRVNEHNIGKGSQMAKQQGPFTLVYISESLGPKSNARKREVQIKKWSRKKKENLIKGMWK